MSITNFLEINRQAVRDACQKSGKEVLESIEIIRDWFQTQPHLPEIPSDNMIESYLVINEFDIEKTKKNLDMYYTIRSWVPEIFERSNPQLPEMQIVPDEIGVCVSLPKLTKNLYRVHVFKLTENTDVFDMYKYFANIFNVFEVRIQHDLSMGDLIVVDHQNLKMGHVVKKTPTHIKKITLVAETAIANRIKGVHVVNYPSIVDTLFSIVKSVASPKLSGRFQFHSSMNSLYEQIPQEILPREYGGNEASMDELKDIWKTILKNNSERFNKLDMMKVREDLRPTPLDKSEFCGYIDNFKKLEID